MLLVIIISLNSLFGSNYTITVYTISRHTQHIQLWSLKGSGAAHSQGMAWTSFWLSVDAVRKAFLFNPWAVSHLQSKQQGLHPLACILPGLAQPIKTDRVQPRWRISERQSELNYNREKSWNFISWMIRIIYHHNILGSPWIPTCASLPGSSGRAAEKANDSYEWLDMTWPAQFRDGTSARWPDGHGPDLAIRSSWIPTISFRRVQWYSFHM